MVTGPTGPARRSVPVSAIVLAAVALAIHLLPRPGYGFHRDELLYLAMADHLDFLRMQFPPLIAVLGWVAKYAPIGLQSAVHLLSGLAAAGIVLTGVVIARRLGAGREGCVIAGVALVGAPLLVRGGALFQPVIFEMLWWSVAMLAFAALLDDGDRRWWLVMGAMAGLGGLTKFSAAIFGGAMGIAVILSPLRKDFRGRWPWIAVVIGGAIALPSVVGQMHWDWPFFVQAQILRATQLARVTPGEFLAGQLLLAGIASPVLIAGFVGLLFARSLARFRALGVMALVALVALIWLHGKEYYLGPVHPTLLAAGGALVGNAIRNRRALYAAAVGVLAIGGIALLPVGVPVFAPTAMARYFAAIGLTRAVTTNRGDVLPLPQDYADMLGWREQVAAVAAAYRALPDSDRTRTTIVGGNYGRAGALAVYHREFGLPYPVSRSGDFYNWGPGPARPEVVIVVGGTPQELERYFGSVVEAGRTSNPLGVDEEQVVPILLCRELREPLDEIWRSLGPDWD